MVKGIFMKILHEVEAGLSSFASLSSLRVASFAELNNKTIGN